ncbi:MAG: SLBB domain-containing protein [candidate division Zixibacteria bacterium]
MKRNLFIAALVIILICINWLKQGFAQDDLTPEQIKAYQELMKKNPQSVQSRNKTYKSPTIFEESDAKSDEDILKEIQRIQEEEKKKVQDARKDEAAGGEDTTRIISDNPDEQLIFPDTNQIRCFGYDLFTNTRVGEIYNASIPDDYLLGPGDNIIINLWGRVQQEWNLTVDRQGKVFIPKVGEITAWGLTLTEFEEQLDNGIAKVYTGFKRKVTIGKIRTIKVFVYGEVNSPGGYAVSALSTLFNALYKAGGPTANGSLRQIKLIRDKKQKNIDLYDFLVRGDKSCDTPLLSGDVIFVPLVGPQVTIRGEVKRPAIYELVNNERISDLLALAGGPTAHAFMERLMLDRVSKDDSRKIMDINFTDENKDDLLLAAGDDLSVFSIYKMRQNLIWITGMVKHPGTYERTDFMRISDLIEKCQLCPNNVFLDRADLYRRTQNGQREIIAVNLRAVMEGDAAANIQLADLDSLEVFDVTDIERKKFVHIEGLVQNQGRYPLYKNMTISDLIFHAGNLDASAYMLEAELARIDSLGNTEILNIQLHNDSHKQFRLHENDHLFIRKIPGYQLHRTISIEGEVQFPGVYTLTHRNETFWELLIRAGGFTDKAFPIGTICKRPAIMEDLRRKDIEGIINNSQPLVVDSSGEIRQQKIMALRPNSMDRIILDMDLLLETNGSQGDFKLQAGDYIHIPEIPTGIPVLGEVCANGTIKYQGGMRVKEYLKKAGGFTKRADKGETRLIKANGHVYASGGVLKKKVDLGDVIVVPAEIKKEKDWFKFISTSLSILTGVATSILIIDRL